MVSHKRSMAAKRAVTTKRKRYGKDLVSAAGALSKARKLRQHHHRRHH